MPLSSANWIQPDEDTCPPYSVLGHMSASECVLYGRKLDGSDQSLSNTRLVEKQCLCL
jgi:hypothetical protein